MSNKTAKLYLTDNVVITVKPENGKTFTCKELNSFVDGYFEFVSRFNNETGEREEIMVVNEEGKCRGMLPNLNATAILKIWFGKYVDIIAGPALVCPAEMIE